MNHGQLPPGVTPPPSAWPTEEAGLFFTHTTLPAFAASLSSKSKAELQALYDGMSGVNAATTQPAIAENSMKLALLHALIDPTTSPFQPRGFVE